MDFFGIGKLKFLESYQKPSPHLDKPPIVFRFINNPTEQYFHDISHFIPNTMLRIRYDANIPYPTLSISDITEYDKYNSSYVKIPEEVDVIFLPASYTFNLEHFSTVTKMVGSRSNFAKPHNVFIYNLMPHNNYQIRYKGQVMMNLVVQQGWNIS